jgi:hypothetical protein
MLALIERLLMRLLPWRRDASETAGTAPGVRTATEQNTLETDRQVSQMIQSAVRQETDTEHRAQRSATVLRRLAEQAFVITEATRPGRGQ